MYSGAKRTFPFHQVRLAKDTVVDLTENWESDLGIKPTRHLEPRVRSGNGVTVNTDGKVLPGYILMSGFFEDRFGVRLVDRAGNIIHSWPMDYHRIFPDTSFIQRESDRPKGAWDWEIQGALPQPDGSLVVNFYMAGLAKLDRCGKVLWTLKRQTHHILVPGKAGTFWVPAGTWYEETPPRLEPMEAPFYENGILHVGADGKVLREISFLEVLLKDDLHAVMSSTGQLNPLQDSGFDSEDPLHMNDINIVTAEQSAKIPGIEEGNILVSARNLDLLVAFDPETLKVTWYQVGPWLRQHDPEILSDGRISVFNNNYEIGTSNVMALDPVTREPRILYGDDPKETFYSGLGGRQRQLPNGNILVTSTVEGRMFEIDGSGIVVWEYVNGFDENHVAGLLDGLYYPESYFYSRDWHCPSN